MIRFLFSTFKPQTNALKNGFRFENQNITWTFEEFETHSNAFAYGLLDQGWKVGDKLLMMLGRSNTCEAAAVFVGAAKAGVITVPFRSNNAAEIESAIKSVNPKGMVFSPNQLVGDTKFIDVLQTVVPESKTAQAGMPLKSKFSNLQWLIHTGFYSYPGTYKFRESLCYASKNFNRLALPTTTGAVVGDIKGKTYTVSELEQLYQKVAKSENVIVSGDPQTLQNFAVVLGGLQKGYYTVFTGSEKGEKLATILPYYKNASLVIEGAVLDNQDLSKIQIQESTRSNLQNIFTYGESDKVAQVFQRETTQL